MTYLLLMVSFFIVACENANVYHASSTIVNAVQELQDACAEMSNGDSIIIDELQIEAILIKEGDKCRLEMERL